MKFFNLLALLTVISASSFAYTGKTAASVALKAEGSSEIYNLVYAGASQKVRVTIRNAAGRLLFTEVLRLQSFSRPYNFSNLPHGTYHVEVTDDSATTVKTVVLGNKAENKSLEAVSQIRSIPNEKSKYVVSVGNTESSQILVKIYDQWSNLVYKGSENVEGDFAKVFNLEAVKSDLFVFEVFDSNGLIKRSTM